MKEIIVLCSIIFLLLLFPLQDMKDISTNRKLTKFDLVVENTCEQAKQEGYFTPELVTKMKNDIILAFPEVDSSEISVSVTDTPKYRVSEFDERECIYYDVSVPVKNVIAMGDFFGISEKENTIIHHKKGYVLSEVLKPWNH